MQPQRSVINFEGQNFYIGIDVHKKSWTVSIMGEKLLYQTFSQPPTAEALKSHLEERYPGGSYFSVYEAGFSGFWAHYALLKAGIKNIVVNPADVPTTQKEKLHKNDPVDSKKLARSLRANELEAIYVLQKSTIEERSLVRARATVVRDLTRVKQRIQMFLNNFGIELPTPFNEGKGLWSKRFIKWLNEEVPTHLEYAGKSMKYLVEQAELLRALLLKITQEVKLLCQTERYSKGMKLMRSIPGVGLITAITFLVEIEDIKRFKDADHFAGYVGLKPTTQSSGEKDKKGEMTFRGQKVLRKALIESTWHAVRLDPVFSVKYNALTERMASNNAIIRIAKKLLSRMYYVLKNEQEYECGVVK